MKKILAGVIVLALVGAGLWLIFGNKKSQAKYTTVPVKSGSLRSMVTATGTVNAVKTVSVGTQISGTLKELHVDYNSRVKKGQVIAEIDPATQQAQVDQARANLMVARANAEKAKAVQEDAQRIRDRNQQLLARNLIARADVDTSETNYQSNKAQVSAAMAQIAQSEAALRNAQTNLGYTKIISPVDGIVVSRAVDVGQTVAASFQTPTLFTIAQDLTKMQIDTSIDEADIGKIEKGQKVEFTVDAYPDNMFRGVVDEVRIAPITVSNVVTYDVVVKVSNDELKLKPGMTANVSIITASRNDVLMIPNSALRFKPSEKELTNAKNSASKITADSSASTPAGVKPGSVSGETGSERIPGQYRKSGSSGTGGERMRKPVDGLRRSEGESGDSPQDTAPGGAPGQYDRPRGPRGEGQGDPQGRTRRPMEGAEGLRRPSRPEDGAGEAAGVRASVRTAGQYAGGGGQRAEGQSTRPAGALAGNPGQTSRTGITTQTASRRYTVWILENDKPKQVIITTGISDGSFTEVASGDLKEGQPAITGSSEKPAVKNNNPGQSGPPTRFFR